MSKIILASKSPRRRELLSVIFKNFDIEVSDADETMPDNLSPADCASEIAYRKLCDIKSKFDDALIIAADTIVVLDNKILGKPKNEADAFNMLSSLSGRTHTVYTGVALSYKDKLIRFSEDTSVSFRPLSADTIRAYIETKEPMDKAGAYGIQNKGALFVEKIEGDYFNVVGLPICRLATEIEKLGFSVL